jgi:SAM-dependent methyltransferase
MQRAFVFAALAACCLVSLPAGWAAEDDDQGSADGTPDVVYVGSPNDVVAKMLELAAVKKDDVVYDLGCGDGRIVVAAAKKYGCQGVGFDVNPVRIREALESIQRNGVQKLVRIERKDIFTLDLSPASVVTLYLLPDMNKKLLDNGQFDKLRPGSRIVAHDYDIEGVTPDKTVTMDSKVDGVEHYVYLYTVPLKKTPPTEDEDDE